MALIDPYFMPEKEIGSFTLLFDAYEVSSSVAWDFPPFAIPGVSRLVVSFIIQRNGRIKVRPYLAMHNNQEKCQHNVIKEHCAQCNCSSNE